MSLTFVLLLVVPLFAALATPAALAQRTSDPWWDVSDRTRPTEGYAIRVPIVVENNQSYPLRSHPVAVEIDFTKLLLEAGWTSRTVLAEQTLQGFTLDVDSLRVVEYGQGFASGPVDEGKPVPHAFYPALLTAERARDFDATTNPAGTVLFAPDTLAPGEKRFYYLYANPLQFGKREPYAHELKESAPLDAFLWGTAGTVFYGFQPQQKNDLHRIFVFAPLASTTVTLYEYRGGGFQPVESTTLFPNPRFIPAGGTGELKLPSNTGAPFKVESDAPIRVAMHGRVDTSTGGVGDTSEVFAYVPSTSNSFAGTSFNVFGFRNAGNGVGPVTVMRAGNVGSVEVRTDSGASLTLTGASPVQTLNVPNRWSRISASADILVMHGVRADVPFHAHAVPARTGGPSGTQFYALVPPDGGYSLLCPEGETTLRAVDSGERSRQLLPPGNRDTTPALHLDGEGCVVGESSAGYPTMRPVEFFATVEPDDPVAPTAVPFRLVVGAEERLNDVGRRSFVGTFGGLQGIDFHTVGPTGLFGHFNGTKVTILEEMERAEPRKQLRSLGRDTFFALQPSEGSTGRFHIVSNKPMTAVSTNPADHPYGFYLGGRPLELPVTLGAAEFRGPLVSLRSTQQEGTDITRATGPDTPVAFPLQVRNLGRWIGGSNLPDTIRVECSDAPLGWRIDGCGETFRLDSGVAADLTVTVTPSADDVDKPPQVITVTATSELANVSATMKLRVKVTISYGVDMRFDGEGGRKTIDPPIGLDPGETHTYDIYVKNTGSSRDTFRLDVEPARDGWRQVLLHEGREVRELVLDGGASTFVQFVVTAPEDETAGQNDVSIVAQSLGSLGANARVNTATRIRPNVDVRFDVDPVTQVAAPNETAVFNLSLVNRGNAIFRVAVLAENALPQGWTHRFVGIPDNEINVQPGESARFNFTLEVTPPPTARAGELATLNLAAETDTGDGGGAVSVEKLAAFVLVRRVHNLSMPSQLDVETQSGVTLDYVLSLTNAGNGEESVELLPGAVTPRWRLASPVAALPLEHGGSGEFPLSITVPGNATPGPTNLTFTVRLSREATQNLTIPMMVLPTARVAFEGLGDLSVLPGQPRLLSATVRNVGNVPAAFDLATQAPTAWNVTFEPSTLLLAPGESAPVRVVVNASREADDGAYTLALRPDAQSGVAGEVVLDARLARPDLYVERVESDSRPRAGELILVRATIGNRGEAAAENVSVALVVDGAVVDQVEVARVPPGEPRIATLSWLATESPGAVSVVIDPESVMVETSRAENVAQVEFASRLPMPPLPLLLLALLGVALVARRWRA